MNTEKPFEPKDAGHSPREKKASATENLQTRVSRSPLRRSIYSLSRWLSRIVGKAFFRLRWAGSENYPTSGGGLVCANHQSFFDPVLVGLTCDRQMNYLARKTLFRFAPFRWLISCYDAIPIDREGMGIAGLKETLRRLRRGELVVIFPEGTRTRDGKLQSLQSGFCAVARRGKQPLIPVAIDGAYDAWPRNRKMPRLSRISVVVGEPLPVEKLAEWDDEQLVHELSCALATCLARAKALRE